MVDASVLQSALQSAGPQAARIEHLWWLHFWITAAVFIVTMAFVALAVGRGRANRIAPRTDATADGAIADRPDFAKASADEPLLNTAVAIAVGATIAILFVLLVATVFTSRAIASPRSDAAVVINVTGHQWWWEAQYEGALPSDRFSTANELHIPVGRPIVLKVTSHDVIHSFWVPNLHGKRDLIPGYTTAIWLQADKPGVYRGQCAEFCGHQHAKMALFVTAESDADYQRWLSNQRKPAAEPARDDQSRGRDVFLRSDCTLCHTVRGTIAGGRVGPELTHIAARGTIAAATLPNDRGHLAGWILDPQSVKPGVRMPPHSLPGPDLQALLTYLESLK